MLHWFLFPGKKKIFFFRLRKPDQTFCVSDFFALQHCGSLGKSAFMRFQVPHEDIRLLSVMDGFHSQCNKGNVLEADHSIRDGKHKTFQRLRSHVYPSFQSLAMSLGFESWIRNLGYICYTSWLSLYFKHSIFSIFKLTRETRIIGKIYTPIAEQKASFIAKS